MLSHTSNASERTLLNEGEIQITTTPGKCKDDVGPTVEKADEAQPYWISNADLIRMLRDDPLNILLVDVTKWGNAHIPTAQKFAPLTTMQRFWEASGPETFEKMYHDDRQKVINAFGEEDESGNGETGNDAINSWKWDSHWGRRIDGDVVVYDENGDDTGFAAVIAKMLIMEGRCKRVFVLQDGMDSFCGITTGICRCGSGSEEWMIELKQLQQGLVDGVWYTETQLANGDIPIPILEPHLYLGSERAAKKRKLMEAGIQNVIRLGRGFTEKFRGIRYFDFAIEDCPNEDIMSFFEDTSSLIDEIWKNGQKVLVHCHAGVSRSATIVLAYLITRRRMSLKEAFEWTFKRRPIIRPNYGFAKSLQDLELKHHNFSTPTIPAFWMSESYFYYLDVLELQYRVEKYERDSLSRLSRDTVSSLITALEDTMLLREDDEDVNEQ